MGGWKQSWSDVEPLAKESSRPLKVKKTRKWSLLGPPELQEDKCVLL